MQGVLLAPFAILHHFDTFRIILLVLVCAIIAALAFCASKSNSITHCLHLTWIFPVNPITTCLVSISYAWLRVNWIFHLKKPGFSQQNHSNIRNSTKQAVKCSFFTFFIYFCLYCICWLFPLPFPVFIFIVLTIYTYTERREQGFRKAYPLRSPCFLSILVQCFISSMRIYVWCIISQLWRRPVSSSLPIHTQVPRFQEYSSENWYFSRFETLPSIHFHQCPHIYVHFIGHRNHFIGSPVGKNFLQCHHIDVLLNTKNPSMINHIYHGRILSAVPP